MSDPEEITIIVHSANGVQGKKTGRHKFSVIFGLGGTKFRTAIVKEATGNPEWNEESIVSVSNVLDQVYFIVTEKDDILGQISIPVTSLRGIKGQARRAPLQPHKKCPKPQGELVYQCYVSKYRAPGDHLPIIKSVTQTPEDVRPRSAFQRLRKRMASPVTQRRNKKESDHKEHKSGLSSFNKKFSRSIQDLFSFNKFSASETLDVEDNDSTTSSQKEKSKYRKKFSLSFLSVGQDLDKAGGDSVITSVTPNSGPTDQPTRLTIEGRNLGIGKSDILSLKVAGCDCTDTIEFESSSRIYCTTHFWKVCKGVVVIDTISGGIGTLKDGYSFYEELDANDNPSTNPFANDTDDDIFKDDGSEKLDFSIGGKEIKSGSNTIPRIKNASIKSTGARSPVIGGSPVTTSTPTGTTAPGRYQKKHMRHASESTVQASSTSVTHVSKEVLQAKVEALQEENAALKKDNVEMKSYIDKLVAKCLIHCPEALAQDDDEKAKLFLL